MISRVLALSALLVITPHSFAQAPNKGDLTLRTRAILKKYCAECHHPDAGHRGEISVLDRAGLDRVGRPFLNPGADSAKDSQLLQLIEDGSMPPGNRPKPTGPERDIIREWITAAAPAYPRQFDDAYVLNAILADVKELPEGDRPHARYLSLHAVINDALPEFTLSAKRDVLDQTIAALAVKDAPAAVAVDPVGAVVRVDLRRLGWSMNPFHTRARTPAGLVNTPSKVNLFDVVLMEYPHGRLDRESAAVKELGTLFLKPAGQVMPVTYLRADWLTDEFARSSVAKELCDVLERPLPQIAATMGPAVPQPPGKGLALVPFNSLIMRDIPADPPIDIRFEFRDFTTKLPRDVFNEGDRMLIYFRPTKQVWIEISQTDPTGKSSRLGLKEGDNLVGENQDKLFSGEDEKGLPLRMSGKGKESMTVYAGESEFASAVVLKASVLKTKERMTERILHRLYSLPEEKQEFDPKRMAKKTIEYEIRAK